MFELYKNTAFIVFKQRTNATKWHRLLDIFPYLIWSRDYRRQLLGIFQVAENAQKNILVLMEASKGYQVIYMIICTKNIDIVNNIWISAWNVVAIMETCLRKGIVPGFQCFTRDREGGKKGG